MYFNFTDDCHTGIETIDEEHAKLFDILNRAKDKLDDTTATVQDIESLLEELKDYSQVHFTHEEEYMAKINDPELPLQKKAHASFIAKIDSVKQDITRLADEQVKSVLAELVEFLARWLYKHILSSDLMIGRLAPVAAAIQKSKDSTGDDGSHKRIVEFTDKYKTGIAMVDREHSQLFDIIQETYDTIHNDFITDKYDYIMSILGKLKAYTEKHFADEERYMEHIQYEGLDAQQRAHAAFIDRLAEIDPYEFELEQDQLAYLDDTVQFLLGWLENHILYTDKLIPVVAGAEKELQ